MTTVSIETHSSIVTNTWEIAKSDSDEKSVIHKHHDGKLRYCETNERVGRFLAGIELAIVKIRIRHTPLLLFGCIWLKTWL